MPPEALNDELTRDGAVWYEGMTVWSVCGDRVVSRRPAKWNYRCEIDLRNWFSTKQAAVESAIKGCFEQIERLQQQIYNYRKLLET